MMRLIKRTILKLRNKVKSFTSTRVQLEVGFEKGLLFGKDRKPRNAFCNNVCRHKLG